MRSPKSLCSGPTFSLAFLLLPVHLQEHLSLPFTSLHKDPVELLFVFPRWCAVFSPPAANSYNHSRPATGKETAVSRPKRHTRHPKWLETWWHFPQDFFLSQSLWRAEDSCSSWCCCPALLHIKIITVQSSAELLASLHPCCNIWHVKMLMTSMIQIHFDNTYWNHIITEYLCFLQHPWQLTFLWS